MKREIYVMRKIFFIALSLLFCFFTACDNAPVDAPFPLDEEQIPLDDEPTNNSERPIEQDDKLNVTADVPAVDAVGKLYIVEANIVVEETRAANGEIIQNYYRNSFLLKAADPDEPYTSDIYAINASDSTETLVSPFREINEFLYYSSSHD